MVKKFTVSTFVVFTFIAYAIHDRLSGSDSSLASAAPLSPETGQASVTPQPSAVALVPSPTDEPPSATPKSLPPTLVVITPAAPASSATVAPSPTDIPSPTDVPPSPTVARRSGYQDGQYVGAVADAFFGNVQVKAVIQSGRIADVQFLQYPSDRRTSVRINSFAVPALRNEAIRAQNARVNIISGATLTSEAFIQSLQTALNKATA